MVVVAAQMEMDVDAVTEADVVADKKEEVMDKPHAHSSLNFAVYSGAIQE